MNDSGLEVEVKFYSQDLTAVRQQLLAVGAVLKKARVYERNVRFDTADQRLFHRFELLRLRQDTAAKVTFKAPTAVQLSSEAKVREEIELEISDFDKMALIFERLGFAPVQVYEKYRETFQLDHVEIVLDELPYGNFIELEGSENEIKTAVSRLNLDWNNRILDNYLSLMAQLKMYHNLAFDDLTFENFKNLEVTIQDVL